MELVVLRAVPPGRGDHGEADHPGAAHHASNLQADACTWIGGAGLALHELAARAGDDPARRAERVAERRRASNDQQRREEHHQCDVDEAQERHQCSVRGPGSER
jgi:hypothetical protein